MNEWKSCFFFFSGLFFFFRQKIRMNEWHLNFSVEKKKNKKTHKNSEKKIQATFIKKKGNFIKIWLNDRWTFPREKKKTAVFFFSRFAGKKKIHDFRIWMNEWPTSMSAKKKNTVPLLGHMNRSDMNRFAALNRLIPRWADLSCTSIKCEENNRFQLEILEKSEN